MTSFSPDETLACRRLVDLALAEDFGDQPAPLGDPTSFELVPGDLQASAVLMTRTPGVVAGLPAVALVLAKVHDSLRLETVVPDAGQVTAGQPIARISGPLAYMLAAERTALNFLQRLSGIATLTRRYVDVVAGLRCQILDTRKTTPGWRLLEKYAVRCGGGHNHRVGLYDQFLIKDNHLAAEPGARTSIRTAIKKAREHRPALLVEIEVDTLDQLDEALAMGPDIILLDNMTPAQMREAVSRRDSRVPSIKLEASGGVNLQTVRAIAETGVDRISVGALTHSAPALDIGLDFGAILP